MSGAHLDLDRITRFVHLYQDITPLTMGELWALPVMLRLGALECPGSSPQPHHRPCTEQTRCPRHDHAPRDHRR